jgi:hypothetical protein
MSLTLGETNEADEDSGKVEGEALEVEREENGEEGEETMLVSSRSWS